MSIMVSQITGKLTVYPTVFTWKGTPKVCIIGHLLRNRFPSQRTSDMERISISWCMSSCVKYTFTDKSGVLHEWNNHPVEIWFDEQNLRKKTPNLHLIKCSVQWEYFLLIRDQSTNTTFCEHDLTWGSRGGDAKGNPKAPYTVECLYNSVQHYIVGYCLNNCRNWGRISILCWIHERQPVPHPNGWAMECLLWIIARKLTRL